jgi:hypothetical protein
MRSANVTLSFKEINECSMTRTVLGKVVTITADAMVAACRPTAARSDENAVSRNVLIHQTQDQGVEAVRPGAGRDHHDQHNGIKRLR